MTSTAQQKLWQRTDLLAVALFCITLLIFAPARNHEYVNYDDHSFVDPPIIQRGLTWEGFKWSMTATQIANWHPITILSHMMDAQLFGPGPAGPHFVNALLHAINALLVFVAVNALTRQRWPSLVVAALFAAHPLRVESVAWVAERKDLLSALFFLLTLIAYERYARGGKASAYLLAVVAFVLGLMSKPMLVTLPCVLLLLDVWPLNRELRWGKLIIEKIPFFVLALAASVVTYYVQHAVGAMVPGVYSLPLRVENAVYAYGRYLWKTIWPVKLAVFYPYIGALPGTQLPIGWVVTSAVVLLLITMGALLVWRSNRAPLIGWLWFLGMLVPVIGLVQVGTQSMADRYAYLPHIGLFIAIVFALMPLAKRVPAGGLTVGIIAVLGALTYRTEVQLATWQDTISVFTHALAVTTHNHVAHNNLAYVYMQDEATRPLAMEHLREALKINPLSREPYYNMGLLYEATGDHKESQPWFEQAIARDPRFADAHLNLANTLLGQHQLESAIAHYQRAVQLAPESFLAHYNFGLAISQRDGDAAALPQFERAVHLVPDHAEARYSYAMALRAAGRQAEATEQFLTAAKLAQDQHLGDLQAEIERQQKQNSALPKPTTNAENPHP